MKYDNMINYELFLTEQLQMQNEILRYVEECCLISESKNTVSNMISLNESFTDTAKDIFTKIKNIILKIWNKFVEATNNLIKSDKQYLDRYRDIILRKKPISCTYTMFNYPKGVPNIIRVSAPQFNYQQMEPHLENKEKFISEYFKEVAALGKPPYEDFADLAKSLFRGGGEVKIDSQELNMTDIFNYCYTYNTIKDAIQKDINTVTNAADNALNEIRKLENSTPKQPEQQQSEQPQNNTNESYYSFVHGTYINEDDTNLNNNTNTQQRDLNSSKGGTGSSEIDQKANPSKAYRSVSKDQEIANQNKNIQDQVKNNKNDDAKKAIEKIKVYLNTCSSFLGAKQTCAENAYKNYMSIIKAHVQDFVKQDPGKDNSKSADVGTNYANDGRDEQPKNANNQENK